MNKRAVQARLIERGSNFSKFAHQHNYDPCTVRQAVERWADKTTLPSGRITFSILRDLSRFIGEEVVPGILVDEFAQTPKEQPTEH
ncbi:hypothetical protein SAMN05216487_2437 [Pseudomonas sp. UC 17F4]|uniref:hypothetical protein n=1 Tax=Pseudomonas sp. UC 17F4 TaxID=1855328 RepID=UPI00088D785E|nr:hypothetical protein [Pseudomonas sp. UC 17F4]SDQ54729.1 hypothetical protein SAMN05216487_2437 [Pseudomonas sp. UC 17F4]